MASYVTQVFDRLRTLCFEPAQAGLGIGLIELSDPYALGAELGQRVQRLGPQKGLPALVVVPRSASGESADAGKRTRKVTLPLEIYFLWKRRTDAGDVELRSVVEQWADPLHDLLCSEQVRRLNNLALLDTRKHETGHVVGFDVGEVDLDPPDNEGLYSVGLCSFRIPVEVYYVSVRDWQTQLGVRTHG